MEITIALRAPIRTRSENIPLPPLPTISSNIKTFLHFLPHKIGELKMMIKAIVFDSAGTLVNVFRVIKDLDTEEYIYDKPSTYLVSEKNSRVLVAINEDLKTVLSEEDNELISSSNFDFEISCSVPSIDKKDVFESIKKDKRAKIFEIKDVIEKNLSTKKSKKSYYVNFGFIVDVSLRERTITHVLSTSGDHFNNVPTLLEKLKKDFDIYIATGDTKKSAKKLAETLGIDEEMIFPLATPKIKEDVINELKEHYESVTMVGDGINDLLAFKASDLSILSTQQKQKIPEILVESVDYVVDNLLDILKISDFQSANSSKLERSE
jgi:Cu+-exporting ATPase